MEVEMNQKSADYVKITECIKRLGIPTHITGYYYARDAIAIMYEDIGYLSKVCALYRTVAKKYNIAPSKVERAIRHAVEVAWLNGDTEFQNKLFSYTVNADMGRPTTGNFITTVVDYLNMLEEHAC